MGKGINVTALIIIIIVALTVVFITPKNNIIADECPNTAEIICTKMAQVTCGRQDGGLPTVWNEKMFNSGTVSCFDALQCGSCMTCGV